MAMFATHALHELARLPVTTFTNYCKICYVDAHGCVQRLSDVVPCVCFSTALS